MTRFVYTCKYQVDIIIKKNQWKVVFLPIILTKELALEY